MGREPAVSVFLSHSHADRDMALTLHAVLEKDGAKVFLDQDQILAGDDLPSIIRAGIGYCDVLLVLWSFSASCSRWVERELQVAKGLGKKIVPYRLDATPLSPALQHLVFIERDDQFRAHAQLLTAIFGRSFEPRSDDPTRLFPGKWRAEVSVAGIVGGAYDIELRMNGQVSGSGRLQAAGFLADIARREGFEHIVATPVPVRGEWNYDDHSHLLTMTWTSQGYGQIQTETIRILATGRELGAIQGTDLGGRLWTLQRVVENSGPGGEIRKQIRSLYQKLDEPGVRPVFIGVVAFGIEKSVIPLSMSELRRLIGSNNWFEGKTDKLVAWLQSEGWLDIT